MTESQQSRLSCGGVGEEEGRGGGGRERREGRRRERELAKKRDVLLNSVFYRGRNNSQPNSQEHLSCS